VRGYLRGECTVRPDGAGSISASVYEEQHFVSIGFAWYDPFSRSIADEYTLVLAVVELAWQQVCESLEGRTGEYGILISVLTYVFLYRRSTLCNASVLKFIKWKLNLFIKIYNTLINVS
jgi:hypothetical protein